MKSWCWIGLMIVASSLAGCTDDYIPIIDPKPATGNLTAETSAPKTVDLTVAKAWFWNNQVTVMGSAQPTDLAGNEKISGFIDIEILDRKNKITETAMASLAPSMLSHDQPSQFKISMWTKTPAASHLKVVFVDKRDEAAYLGNDGGGGPGSPSQSGNYSRPSSYGNTSGDFDHGVVGVSGTEGIGGVGGVSSVGRSR